MNKPADTMMTCGVCSEPLERVDLNGPNEYVHAGDEPADNHAPVLPAPADPSPSDVAYDDMTRAWRNGDHPLAWALADALLQYLTDGGQPLTGNRSLWCVRQLYVYYAPVSG